MPDTPDHTTSPQSWSPLLEALPLGVVMADAQGQFLQANAAALHIMGMDREQLLSRNLLQPLANLMATDGSVLAPEDTPGARALRTGKPIHRQVLGVVQEDGNVAWLEVSAEPLSSGGVLATFEDVTRHHLTESILASRARIAELSATASLEGILRTTLDEAERLTGSCIGFYHFMEADQETLTLQAWSTRTEQEFCQAEGKGMHYSVGQAGVWVDAVHARKPVIHNDYASLPHTKGLPKGHATVLRELVVPVLRGDKIVALLGVGNKPFPYGARDLQTVMALADLSWDLAERKLMESRLQESEARYRSQFEHMTQGAFRQAADGTLIDVNPAALELFGLTRETFLSRNSLNSAWDVVNKDGSPLPGEQHPSMVALRTGQKVSGRIVGILNPSTEERVWLEVSAVPECREGVSQPFQVLVTLHDLTARRKAEAAALAQQSRTKAIFDTTLECLFLTDAKTHCLVEVNPAFVTLTGYSREEALGRSTSELNLWWDPAERVPFLQSVQALGRAELALMRIRTKDGRLVWGQANSLPLELDSGHFLLHTVRDVTARVEAEQALRESEARWHTVVEQAGDGFELLDENGRYLQVNAASCRSLGYSREELLQLSVVDIDPKLTLDRFHAEFTGLIDQPPVTFETTHCGKDGTTFPVEVTASVIRLGDHHRALTLVRDITDRKKAEEGTRAAKDQLQLVLDSLEAHVAVLDGRGNILSVNERWRAFAQANGISETCGTVEQVNYLDAIGNSIQAAEVDLAGIRLGLKEVLQGQRPSFQAEYPCDSPTEQRWFRMHAVPLLSGQGGAVVTHENITEEKLAVLALEKAHEQLAFAQQAAGAGTWEWDLAKGTLTWSREMFELYGLDPARDQATIETFRKVLHPDDRPIVEANQSRLMANKTPFDDDYRIVLSNGCVRWIHAQGAFELDAQGQPIRVAGICVDRTPQKIAEVALEASEAQARAMLRTAQDGVWVLDREGRFKETNEAACRMLGVSHDTLIGRQIADFEVEESPEEVQRHIQRIMTRGWDIFESRLHRQDGFVFPVEISTTYQADLEQLVVFARDISTRKVAEALLQESETRLRAIVENSSDAIGVSKSGVHVMVNPAYLEVFGFTPEEDLTGTSILDLIAPESHALVAQYASDRSDGRNVPKRYEVKGLRKNKTTFDMAVHASTYVLDGSVFTLVILRDITARKQAEQALRQSEARFRTMFEDSPIGIWEEDFSEVKQAFDALRSEGVVDFRAYFAEHPAEVPRLAGLVRVLAVNRASVRILKAGSEAELVRNLPAYFTPDSMRVFKEELIALAEGKTRFSFEGEHLDSTGHPLTFEISVSVEAGQEATYSRVLVSMVDVTERKFVESSLRESELRMREAMIFNEQLLATMPVGAVVYQADSGRCILANEAMAHAIGATQAAMLEQCFREIPSWQASGLTTVAERVLRTGFEEHLEFHLHSTFGKECWLACELSAFMGVEGKNLLILGVDITQRKQSEDALSRSERQYRGLFESMLEGFALHEIITDDAGRPVDYRFLDVNPAFVAMTGLSREAWIGRTMLDILPGESPRWIHEYGQVALTGKGITFEEESKELGRWYRVTAYRPALHQFAVLVTDITEHKRVELERQQLDQQMARAQKMESLGSLAGGVAHDMNNVLGAIMGLASIHQDQAPEDSRLRKSMDTILKACTRGRTLVKGLLGFARQGLEEIRVLDLNEIIREEVALLERTIPANVLLAVDLSPTLPPMLGDPASISHLLMNLCVNAVDAMPEGGTLSLRTRPAEPASLTLEVEDTGCGMPPEVMEKALDPFFTTKAQGKGTGLGLAIVYGAVKAHHGRLELASTPGIGTCIQITFPASTDPCELESPAASLGTRPRSLRILVVDDDELIQDSLCELLRSLGHLPTVAACGEEGLQQLASGLPIDAVVLDLNMPGLGGLGTLPLLRTAYPALPVLLATGKADQLAMDLVTRTSRTILLPKPFSGAEITTQLQLLGLG